MAKNNNEQFKANNETEFVLSNEFYGFTTIQNYILEDDRISDNAIGLYMRIAKYQNSKEHKIYLKGLITDVNKRTKVTNAMNELIKLGYITREEIREQGRFKGCKYTVYMKPVEVAAEEPKEEVKEEPKAATKALKVKQTTKTVKVKEEPKAATKAPKAELEPKVSEAPKVIPSEDQAATETEIVADQGAKVVAMITSETQLKLTRCQKKTVSTWDIEKTKRAVEVFNEIEGIYFSLLHKIYKEGPKEKGSAGAAKSVSKKVEKYNNLGENGRKLDYDEIEKLERLKQDYTLGLISLEEFENMRDIIMQKE